MHIIRYINRKKSENTIETSRKELMLEKKRFSFVYKNTSIRVWEYDYITKKVTTDSEENKELYGKPAENVPQSLIEQGCILPDSIEDYKKMYEELRNGAPSTDYTIHIKNQLNNETLYERIIYTNVFDSNGKPYRAIGMSENVTESREKELAFARLQDSMLSKDNNSFTTIEYNITRNIFEKCSGYLFGDVKEINNKKSFDENFHFFCENFIFENDKNLFEGMSQKKLLENHYDGKNSLSFDCRALNRNGDLIWINVYYQTITYPDSRDIKAFVTFSDIDREKRKSLELIFNSEYDYLTELYNRKAIISRINNILTKKTDMMHAIVMFDLDKFKSINDNFGHLSGDSVLTNVAKKISLVLEKNDILGRIGGDEFILCLENVSKDLLVEHVELFRKAILSDEDSKIKTSGSFGIAVYPDDGTTFDELYKNADIALYASKYNGGNQVTLYSKNLDNIKKTVSTDSAHNLVDTEETKNLIIRRKSELIKQQQDYENYNLVMKGSDAIIISYDYSTDTLCVSNGNGDYCFSDEDIKSLFFSSGYNGNGVHPNDIKYFNKYISSLYTDRDNADITIRLSLKDGTYHWCNIKSIVILGADGKPTKVVHAVMKTDFIENSSNIQIRSILEKMEGGIVLIEVKQEINYLYVSKGYYKMLGYDNNDNDEKSASRRILSDSLKNVEQHFRQIAESGEPIDHIYKFLYADGRSCWRRICANRIPYEESKYPVLLAVITDITELKETELMLQASNARINLAFSQSDVSMIEINFEHDTFSIWKENESENNMPTVYQNISDELTKENGLIKKESVPEFKRIINEARDGVQEAKAFIQMKFGSNNYLWIKINLKSICDYENNTCKAVGIARKLPNNLNSVEEFRLEEKLLEFFSGKIYSAIKVNITQNTTVSISYIDDGNVSKITNMPYDKFFEYEYEQLVSDEEKLLFKENLNLETLKSNYYKGKTNYFIECRQKDKSGNIIWISNYINIIENPMNNEIYAFLFSSNSTQHKQFELSIKSRAERDISTNLYIPETFEKICEKVIEKENSNLLCALAIIKCENIEALKDALGNALTNKLLVSSARFINLFFDDFYIIGRMSESSFAVFFPSVTSSSNSIAKINEFMKQLKKSNLTDDNRAGLLFNIGISVRKVEHANCDIMCNEALTAINSKAPDDHENIFLFSNSAVTESVLYNIYDSDKKNYRYVKLKDNDNEEKSNEFSSSLFSCASTLMTAENLSDAIDDVCKTINNYYNASRTYYLKIDSENTITVISEYHANGFNSIKSFIANISADSIGFLRSSIEQRKPMIVEINYEPGSDASQKIIFVPIIDKDIISFAFCVEAPTQHFQSVALIETVTTLLLSERGKRIEAKRAHTSSETDKLTGLLSRDMYISALADINTDSISSVGILASDINALNKSNADFGNEYGDSIICTIAEIILKHFDKNTVYRTSGDEFSVIMTNCTYESFEKRCTSFRDEINKNLMDKLSIGYVWSDNDIHIEKLVANADRIKEFDKQRFYRSIKSEELFHRTEALEALKNDIQNGLYEVYFQPKAAIDTDLVYGAEALIRYNHPTQGFMSPDKFVPYFEKENIVRYLDLYVFDKTLSILQEWMNNSKQLVPISVNFSRQTILDPSTFNEFISIFKKYNVPAKFIEIEITESLGDVERITMIDISGKYSGLGFKLVLDDFGSNYSNLSILSMIKFSTVKLDKSLINDIVAKKESYIIAQYVILMCNELGISCVAEGVETNEQIEKLKQIGCLYAQGFFYNKPIRPDEFAKKYISDITKEVE